MPRKNRLEKAIFQTLAYCDLFAFPLTCKELWERLYFPFPQDKLKITQFKQTLQELFKKHKLGKKKNFYFLNARSAICQTRLGNFAISKKKWIRVKRLTKLLTKLPSIQMIAVTGALAMNNANLDDDIDLLIITRSGRLWLTRLILVGWLELLGYRRRPNDQKAPNKFCLNMFLDEEVLKLNPVKQNLYTAYEIIQAKPIFNRHQTYERFKAANQDWICKYLPNAKVASGKWQVASKDRNFFTKILDFMEVIAYHCQAWYMRSRQTRETVTPHLALFHPQDTGKIILKSWKKISF